MITATAALMDLLDAEGIEFELLAHRHTETAAEEARALGVDPHDVAKTIVLTTDHGFVRAVIPATDRLDVHKVRELLDVHDQPQLVDEDELAEAYSEFELGAVPPIGGHAGDRVLVDRRLADRGQIVIEAGTHDESLRLPAKQLLILAHAAIGDLCHD